MPPPHNGNQYLPFTDLIRVEQIDDVTYRSTALPFSPGGLTNYKGNVAADRAFGGHVYAQAAWAACHTVKSGLHLYNVVGSFLLPGANRLPFIYKVHKIRDGRSFSTRIVNVTQGDSEKICFTSLISFKTPETGQLDVQENVDLWEQYKAALKDKTPADFPEVPGMDVPWYWKMRDETGENDEFPGLDMKKVDMSRYNDSRHPLDKRGIIFYRATGQLPPDPNMHLCAHLYASDRNSLYIVANHMDAGDLWRQMSSLVHTTMFHTPFEDLMFGPSDAIKTPMDDTGSKGRWFAKEDWTTRAASGRVINNGRLWAPDGTQIATLIQDGMIRYTKKPEATHEELSNIRQRRDKWPRPGKL